MKRKNFRKKLMKKENLCENFTNIGINEKSCETIKK